MFTSMFAIVNVIWRGLLLHSDLHWCERLLSLVSFRGRCLPVGVLILYLIYLVGMVTALESLDEEYLGDESVFKYSEIPVNELGMCSL